MGIEQYRQTQAQAQALSPRLRERDLVVDVNRAMASAWESGLRGPALVGPLHRNRELWGYIAAATAAPDNALPPDLRARLVSLSLWVGRFTSDVLRGRETLAPLIEVNQALIDGLAPAEAPPVPAAAAAAS